MNTNDTVTVLLGLEKEINSKIHGTIRNIKNWFLNRKMEEKMLFVMFALLER